MTTPEPTTPPPARRVPDTGDSAEVTAAESVTCPSCKATNRAGARWCRDCSADLADAAGPVEKAARPRGHGHWLSTRQKRTAAWATGVLVLLLVLGGAFYFVQDNWYGGDQPVREYFDSLTAREGYQPPTDIEVGEFSYIDDGMKWQGGCDHSKACRPNANYGAVDVSYVLDGETVESSVVVTRSGDGWFREWSLADTLNQGVLLVDAPTYVTELTAAGKTWKAQPGWEKDDADTSVNLDPGVYTLGVPDNPLIAAEPVEVAVPIAPGPPGDRTPTKAKLGKTSIKDSAVKAVDKQVRKSLDECAANDGDREPGCGWAPDALLVDEDTIKWTLESYPDIKLEVPDGGPGAQAIQVVTTEPGKAEMSYQRIHSSKTKTEDIEVSVGGGVDVKDGKVVWPLKEDMD